MEKKAEIVNPGGQFVWIENLRSTHRNFGKVRCWDGTGQPLRLSVQPTLVVLETGDGKEERPLDLYFGTVSRVKVNNRPSLKVGSVFTGFLLGVCSALCGVLYLIYIHQ
jgi:hypothetical protein